MNRIRSNLGYFNQLLLRLGIILIVFTLIKVVFYYYNAALFSLESKGQLTAILFYALRFDIAAIIYINALLILLSLLPVVYRQKAGYQAFQRILFLGFNGVAITFELIDIGFFKFAFRRTIGSDLTLFKNTAEMIPGFLFEYWLLPLGFILLMVLLNYCFSVTKRFAPDKKLSSIFQIGLFILGALLFGIGARGGIQLRPVMPITALQYVQDTRDAALVSNTSIGLIFSSQQKFLEEVNYFPKAQQEEIFNTTRQYHSTDSIVPKNIFLIVLESFGQEHISHFNPKLQTTPFLDTLIEQSFYLEQSYANGLRSTQGIVAITAGLPSMMRAPLMFSAYQSNRVDGLARLLQNEGYTTSFFHGANPGSMEFERFSKLSGFEHYYDRTDFNNDKEYDGQWGIWDAPFFQYAIEQVSQYEIPFLALTFSLTSHHPYKTPESFEQKYPDMKLLHRSIRYTDDALQKFFETAKTMPWYQNTIFVITADHIGKSSEAIYQTKHGMYRIPILIFDPMQTLKGEHQGIAQQIDIMPTVLDLVNYNKPFKSYGESMLDTARNNYSFNFNNDLYQILDENYLLFFDQEKVIGHYQYTTDPFLKENLIAIDSIESDSLEDALKAIIQQYHQEMIHNELSIVN